MQAINKKAGHLFSLFVLLVALAFSQSVLAKEWYQGGTLHQANGLEWQKASYDNKLATMGDMAASVYNEEKFIPDIQNAINNMDGLKVLANELVKQMDAAFKADPDPAQNKKLFTSQKVSETAAMIMLLSGWIK